MVRSTAPASLAENHISHDLRSLLPTLVSTCPLQLLSLLLLLASAAAAAFSCFRSLHQKGQTQTRACERGSTPCGEEFVRAHGRSPKEEATVFKATVFNSCTKRCNGRTLLEENRVQSVPLDLMRRRKVQTLSQGRSHTNDRDSRRQ